MTDDREELITSTLDHLSVLLGALELAQRELPPVQRRGRSADYRNIERIDDALLRGFSAAHKQPFPHYSLKVSSSYSSRFYKIISICFRTIGASDNPERAIKNYIRIRRDRACRTAGQ
jgi:hypothetical protein